ncbi:MAG: uroporphyrinogen decarboxylase family protein, partial [Kiritimatiellia bacterium]
EKRLYINFVPTHFELGENQLYESFAISAILRKNVPITVEDGPYFRQLTDLGHRHGLPVVLHSCGAIKRVIPDLIELGVNALHPLQAKADNMSAESLAEFKGKIAFIGGIDTQDLLVNGTPEEVKADVRRVKKLLGPCFVVSPSHETLLPNVPPRNVAAMATAAIE